MLLLLSQVSTTAATSTTPYIEIAVKVVGLLTAITGGSWAMWRQALKPAYAAVADFVHRINALSEKVERIDKELQTNGGGSLKDAVNRQSEQLRQVARELALGGTMMRSIASTSRTPMFQATPGGHYVWVSDTFSRVTGIPLAEAAGMGWVNAIAAEDRDDLVRDWFHAVRDVRAFRADVCMRHVSTFVDVRVRIEAHPVHLADRTIAGFFGTVHVIDGAGADADIGAPYERRSSSQLVTLTHHLGAP